MPPCRYVGNNATNLVDPSGLDAVEDYYLSQMRQIEAAFNDLQERYQRHLDYRKDLWPRQYHLNVKGGWSAHHWAVNHGFHPSQVKWRQRVVQKLWDAVNANIDDYLRRMERLNKEWNSWNDNLRGHRAALHFIRARRQWLATMGQQEDCPTDPVHGNVPSEQDMYNAMILRLNGDGRLRLLQQGGGAAWEEFKDHVAEEGRNQVVAGMVGAGVAWGAGHGLRAGANFLGDHGDEMSEWYRRWMRRAGKSAPNREAVEAAAKSAARISDDVKQFGQCIEFRKRMQRALKRKGVSGTFIRLKGHSRRIVDIRDAGRLVGDDLHDAVRVGDTVFDNLNPQGIPYDEWRQSLRFLDDLDNPIPDKFFIPEGF